MDGSAALAPAQSAFARRPLSWGPGYLQALAGRLMDNLRVEAAESAADLTAFLNNLRFPWSSACSGTDSPAWCFRALADHLASQGCHVTFPHLVSAESHPQKRAFICQAARPQQLFKDIFDLSRPCARNELTGKEELPDGGRESQCYLVGFSCKTVSGLNRQRATAASAIAERVGSTGSTFAGALDLDRPCPLNSGPSRGGRGPSWRTSRFRKA